MTVDKEYKTDGKTLKVISKEANSELEVEKGEILEEITDEKILYLTEKEIESTIFMEILKKHYQEKDLREIRDLYKQKIYEIKKYTVEMYEEILYETNNIEDKIETFEMISKQWRGIK